MPVDCDIRTIREFRRVCNTEEFFDLFPVHNLGCAAAITNSGDNPVQVTLYDSNDGSTWNLLTFAVYNEAGLTALDLVGRASALILFRTVRKYFRIEVQPASEQGVFVSLFEFVPLASESTEGYS